MGFNAVDEAKPAVSLDELYDRWSDCTKCKLGERRAALQQPLLMGGGATGRVLILGEAPSEAEERNGKLLDDMNWKGEAGPLYLLTAMLETAGLAEHCYYTTIVSCRACQPAINNETGQVIVRRGLPVFRDSVPTDEQVKACKDRLYEQIYLVDPVIILALGATAASTLIGRNTALGGIVGEPQHISIPGRSDIPRITEKARVWGRKFKGEMLWPTIKNQVRYLMLPTVLPKLALDTMSDTAKGSPISRLTEDVKKTADIFFKYAAENALIQPKTDDNIEEEDTDDEDEDD